MTCFWKDYLMKVVSTKHAPALPHLKLLNKRRKHQHSRAALSSQSIIICKHDTITSYNTGFLTEPNMVLIVLYPIWPESFFEYEPTKLTSTRLLSWFIFWSNWIILRMTPVPMNLLYTGLLLGHTCLKCHSVRFVGQCTPRRVFLGKENSCSQSSPPTYWCNILKIISDISDTEAPKGLTVVRDKQVRRCFHF